MKNNKSAWLIFFEGLKIYCANIHKFLLYMSFPVLGQVFGLYMIFGLTYWFCENYQDLIIKYPQLQEMSTMFLVVVLTVIPGLLIFTKALWDYLVSYVALNSMTDGYLNTGKVYDFRAHKEIATKRIFPFIGLWLVFGIFAFIIYNPIFWIFGGILTGISIFIYFSLIFQVFTFEIGLSPLGYFKRSFEIVRGNFARTVFLLLILGLLTYVLLPSGLSVIFDFFNWTKPLEKMLEQWAFTLPLDGVELYGITPMSVSKYLVQTLIASVVIGFTLPIRSICLTLWYNNLSEKPKELPKKKRSKKETSKPAKTFKIEKRGIDPEIIRRARLEDDEY